MADDVVSCFGVSVIKEEVDDQQEVCRDPLLQESAKLNDTKQEEDACQGNYLRS